MPAVQAKSLDVLVARFIAFRETQDSPPATIIAFRSYLRRFVQWADVEGLTLAELELDDLDTFIAACYGRNGYSSKKGAVTALRAFYRWAVKRKHAVVNVADGLELPNKPKRRRPTFYEPEQLARLLRDGFDHPRDRLICLLLGRHGQRVSSTIAIKWADVDFRREVIHYPPVKAMVNDGVSMPLDINTATQLKAWKALQRNTGPESFVFETIRGHHRDDDAFRSALRTACKRTGVPYRGAHELRRTCITTLLHMGEPLHVVSAQVAGHSHISTTVDHYAGVKPQGVAEAIARLPY